MINEPLQAIYEMLGPEVTKSADDSPRKRAKMIFEKMDVNNDKELTLKEFVDGCLADKELFQILTNEVKKWSGLCLMNATAPQPIKTSLVLFDLLLQFNYLLLNNFRDNNNVVCILHP